jgi:glycosyltransferase involved in cell wall biosynthesis
MLVWAIERVVAPRADAVITVSDGIAERLQREYALSSRPVVLRNVPDIQTADGHTAGLRDRLGIGDAPLILHQGSLAPRRGCEMLAHALAHIPDAHLLFLGDAWPGYARVVRDVVRVAGVQDRVHFVPSVPIGQLLRHTREADVGVSLLSDDCENHRLALPNKVFEYIAAGIPVVTSDLPELRRLVQGHDVGWTVNGTGAVRLAETLSVALSERGERADALLRAAQELSWATEKQLLLAVYEDFQMPIAMYRRNARSRCRE